MDDDEVLVEAGDDGGTTTAGVRDGAPLAEDRDNAVVGADFRGDNELATTPPFSFLSLQAGGAGGEREEGRGAGVAAAGWGCSEVRSLEHMPEQPGSGGRGAQQTGRRLRRRGGDSGSDPG